jgi:hypothetical protein
LSIDFKRKDYEKALPDWELVSDVVKGERAVKERDTATLSVNRADLLPTKKRYLPMPNPVDLSQDNLLRYQNYLARAVFYNATGRTLWGLVGAAFKRAPEIEIGSLEYLLSDSDGQGVGLLQQVQAALASVLKKGRHALWVDYPNTEGRASRADMAEGRVRANIIGLRPEQIINWRTEKVGASHRLAMVVIHEEVELVGDDGYSVETRDQYRVLKLEHPYTLDEKQNRIYQQDRPKRYVVEVYRSPKSGAFERVEEYAPSRGNGQAWDRIPFVFIGAQDNNPSIDHPPLLDLAVVNLAHYRNSADYEDSCFFSGQPQPWISGVNQHWIEDVLEQGTIYIGSRAPIMLPEGGEFGMAQAQPNSLVKEAMNQKEQQMVALGARLVTKGQAVKTATEAQSDRESEHSVLSLIVENVSEAYTTALRWAAEYMNSPPDVFLEMSRDFLDYQMDAQRITAIVAAWQGGAIPTSDMLASFKRAGLIDPEKPNETILDELEQENGGVDIDLDDGDAERDAN